MWVTLGDGRRRQVRKEDFELLLCARAQGNAEGSVYATFKMIGGSKELISDLARGTFHVSYVGWEQATADLKHHGFNERYLKTGIE